jgi:hypothetical protein
MKKIRQFDIVLIVPIIFCLLLIDYQFRRKLKLPPINIDKQESAFNINNELLKVFNLGQNRLLSGMLWIQTLLESDLEHYKKKDLNSWMYLRFNSITLLDPLFYEAYRYGGQYLSVVKDDTLGAAKIYERGLLKYTDDFWLNFYAGFNYYFELGNYDKAREAYGRIIDHPLAQRVIYLRSLYARISATGGNLEEAYSVIKTAYDQSAPKSYLRENYKKSLYAIRAEIDLKCLNGGKKSCELYDFEGLPYIKNENGKYRAQKEWESFKIKKNTK